MPSALALAAAALIGYLLGAVPVGVLVGRAVGRDPRASGSGRTGATNALRTLGPLPAVIVLLLDIGKGALAALVGGWLLRVGGADDLAGWGSAVGAAAAIVGHVRSIFIGWRGGRGVATALGGLLWLAPLTLLALVPIFALLVAVTRYVSLGSISAAAAAPLAALALVLLDLAQPPAILFAAVAAVIVIVAHADNIERLRAGTERRLGAREEAAR